MARRKAPLIPDELLDQLLAGRDPQSALGRDGLLDELKRALAERALNAEMDHHLDGEAAEGRSNSRNGYGRKTVLTETGKLPIAVPRDRLATFEPQLIAKYRRRLPGFDDKVISMYARGLTVREIQGHLAEIYGIDVSPDLISAVHRRRPGRDRRMAGPAARGGLSLGVLRCVAGEGPRRGHRPQQGGLPRPRRPGRRPQGDPGPVDRADRGRQILAAGHDRAEEPRRRGRAHRRGRRPEGFSRRDHRRIPAGPGPDLHRPPDPQLARVRVLQGPQGGRRGPEGDLSGQGR